jgi:hypothetical protein
MYEQRLIEEAAQKIRQNDTRVDFNLRGPLADLIDALGEHAESHYPCCDAGFRKCYEIGGAAMPLVDSINGFTFYGYPEELIVERKGVPLPDGVKAFPTKDDHWWKYRVALSTKQSMTACSKFYTLGIGFSSEVSFGTDLPWTADAEEIYAHIEKNKGDEKISRDRCVEAIRLLQAAIKEDQK